jgi:hypothetical protein
MTHAVHLFILSLTLATAFIAGRYLLTGLWLWALLALLIGIFWYVEARNKRNSMANITLAGMVVLVIEGLQFGFEPFWALLTILLLLATWDLQHFNFRLEFAKDDQLARQIEQQHLQRLVLTSMLGLGCAGAALLIHFRLSFGLILFLSAIVIVCLSRFIRHVRQESE